MLCASVHEHCCKKPSQNRPHHSQHPHNGGEGLARGLHAPAVTAERLASSTGSSMGPSFSKSIFKAPSLRESKSAYASSTSESFQQCEMSKSARKLPASTRCMRSGIE